MKLDKIKFAVLLNWIGHRGVQLDSDEINQLDNLIDIDVEQEKIYPANNHVDDLMRLMVQGTQKIEAIKTHRQITGFGLKESKDAVEKYWGMGEPSWTKDQLKNKIGLFNHSDDETNILEQFVREL